MEVGKQAEIGFRGFKYQNVTNWNAKKVVIVYHLLKWGRFLNITSPILTKLSLHHFPKMAPVTNDFHVAKFHGHFCLHLTPPLSKIWHVETFPPPFFFPQFPILWPTLQASFLQIQKHHDYTMKDKWKDEVKRPTHVCPFHMPAKCQGCWNLVSET